jgi:hypothetical protein
MAGKISVFRGDTLKGTINLKVIDACDSTVKNPYAIPAACEIAMNWPGATSSVVLYKSTGEIVVIDAPKGNCTYKMNPDKSAQLAIASAEAIDVVVTEWLSKTGDISSGSPIITNMSNVNNLYVGGLVQGAGIPTGAKILTIDSVSQITLDQNATATTASLALTLDGEVTTFERLKIVAIKDRDNP